ncbi:MAG: class I SAM-dependent methyltransferase [Anaerolineales bacterium]
MLPTEDHFIRIYKTRAAAYHALITAEDADGHLLPALQAITPLAGRRILDLGSGSGRIPLLLKEIKYQVVAVDLHHAMLVEQAQQMSLRGGEAKRSRRSNLPLLTQADLRHLPLAAGWADVAIAGWAIGHFTGWYSDWKAEAQPALAEMQRTTKPSGTLIILETMGTGVLEAGPPNAALSDYYAWLEDELGFRRQIITTDYDFGSVERAAELCGTFFGEQMAERVRANRWSRVPEFTGIWSRSRD